MRLDGLILSTSFFQEFFFFFTEVLDLNVMPVEEDFFQVMVGDFYLSFKHDSSMKTLLSDKFTFSLAAEDFFNLHERLIFLQYRKQLFHFSYEEKMANQNEIHLTDPDGRVWCFVLKTL